MKKTFAKLVASENPFIEKEEVHNNYRDILTNRLAYYAKDAKMRKEKAEENEKQKETERVESLIRFMAGEAKALTITETTDDDKTTKNN